MDVIVEYIKSSTAVTALGLPGLITLILYRIYRELVKSDKMQRLTKRQTFVVFLTIILVLAVLAHFIVYLWRPMHDRPAAPPQTQPSVAATNPSSQTPAPPDPLVSFFSTATLNTPLATVESVLGRPIEQTQGTSGDLYTLYRPGNGQIFIIRSRGTQVIAMAGYSRNPSLVVPMLRKKLADFTLMQTFENCRVGTGPKGKRAETFVEGPCTYPGTDGDREATMIFTVEQGWPDCAKGIMSSEGATKADVDACGIQHIHPTGFIVAQDKEGMNDVSSPLYDAIAAVLEGEALSVREIPVETYE